MNSSSRPAEDADEISQRLAAENKIIGGFPFASSIPNSATPPSGAPPNSHPAAAIDTAAQRQPREVNE